VIHGALNCLIGTLAKSLKNMTNERRCHVQFNPWQFVIYERRVGAARIREKKRKQNEEQRFHERTLALPLI